MMGKMLYNVQCGLWACHSLGSYFCSIAYGVKNGDEFRLRCGLVMATGWFWPGKPGTGIRAEDFQNPWFWRGSGGYFGRIPAKLPEPALGQPVPVLVATGLGPPIPAQPGPWPPLMWTNNHIVKLVTSPGKKKFGNTEMTVQVQNCFKIKEITSFGTKTPAPKEQNVRPRQLQPVVSTNFGETVDEAAIAAAYKIAEAENKSFVAAEAVKEAERVSKMAEDADAVLQLALGILEKCNVEGSRDEMVLVA